MLTSIAMIVASALDPDTATVYTGIIAAAAADSSAIDVVTADDLRHAMDQEAARRTLGCQADSSCLAEIANAMGAQLVLYASGAQLEDELVITLQLFDGNSGTGKRAVVRATSRREMSRQLTDETHKLVNEFIASHSSTGNRLRCIVLDLKADASAQAPPTSPAGPMPLLAMVGLGVAGVGAVGVGIGGIVDGFVVAPLNTKALASSTPQVDTPKAYADRDAAAAAAITCYVAGGLLAVAGGAVAAYGFSAEGGE